MSRLISLDLTALNSVVVSLIDEIVIASHLDHRGPDKIVAILKLTNIGFIWGRQDPGGPHVGPMNLAIWEYSSMKMFYDSKSLEFLMVTNTNKPLLIQFR